MQQRNNNNDDDDDDDDDDDSNTSAVSKLAAFGKGECSALRLNPQQAPARRDNGGD
jgi:hypothetical protein